MTNNYIFQNDDVLVDGSGNIYSKYDNILIANCGTSQQEVYKSILEKLKGRYRDISRELDLYQRKIRENTLNKTKLKQIETGLDVIESIINKRSYIGDPNLLLKRFNSLKEEIGSNRELYRENCDEILEKKNELLEQLNTLMGELKNTNSSVRFFKNRYYILVDKWKKLPRLKLAKDRNLWKHFNNLSDQFIQAFEAKIQKENSRLEVLQNAKQQIVDNLSKVHEEIQQQGVEKQKDRFFNTLHQLDNEWNNLGKLPYYMEQNIGKQYLTLKKQLFGKLKITTKIDIGDSGIGSSEITGKRIEMFKELEKILKEQPDNAKQLIKDLENKWHSIGSHKSDNYDKKFFALVNQYYVEEQNKQISNKYSNDFRSKLEQELDKLRSLLKKAEENNNKKDAEQLKKQLELKSSWFAAIS